MMTDWQRRPTAEYIVPVVIVTCPQLAVYSYEGEYYFEQGFQRQRLGPQERVPRSALERLLLAAFEMKSENADKPIRSPDQKEATRQHMPLESTMCGMPNGAGSQRCGRRSHV